MIWIIESPVASSRRWPVPTNAARRGARVRSERTPVPGTTCVQDPAASHAPPSFHVTSACHVTGCPVLTRSEVALALSTSSSSSTSTCARRSKSARPRALPARSIFDIVARSAPSRRLTQTRLRVGTCGPRTRHAKRPFAGSSSWTGTSREKRTDSASAWPTWRSCALTISSVGGGASAVGGAGGGAAGVCPSAAAGAASTTTSAARSAERRCDRCNLLPPADCRVREPNSPRGVAGRVSPLPWPAGSRSRRRRRRPCRARRGPARPRR